MSTWTQFFREAGIPTAAAKRYALVFEDNRITRDLLPDLSKEILLDMGIKVMGDILCILKHAKKEVRKTERSNNEGGAAMLPLAHSTTSGQQDPVSTTSGASRRREPRVQHLSPPEHVDIEGDMEGELVPQVVTILPTLRSDQMSLEGDALRQSGYDSATINESYSTAAYEKSKQKRQATMYADEQEEYSTVKQPRVVVLPGEKGQEMYTATALQRAAAIAVASAAIMDQDKSHSSQRNKKILEPAGLVPAEGKLSGGSVFSRLDGDGPTSSTQISTPSSSHHTLSSPHGVTSQASVTVNTSHSRIAVDTSKPRTIKLGRERKDPVSTLDSKVTSGQKISTASRLGEVISRIPESSGLRSAGSGEISTIRIRLGERKRSTVSSSSNNSIRKSSSKRDKAPAMSMVADEIDYQTQRQRDIRSRLEIKEREKTARRRGPLAGRLEQHHVFSRLE